MATVSQLLQQAVQNHQGGNFHQAELLYRQILQSDPRHVDALHLLGVLAIQAGRGDLAIHYIREALRLQPAFPKAHNNLGFVFHNLGKLEEAISHFREAVRLQPDYAEAHNNLGNALRDLKKPDEASASYIEALRLQPGYAEAHSNLGNALRDMGRLDEAIASCREALRLKPDCTAAHGNLGNALRDQGKVDEAIVHYQEFLSRQPTNAEAHNNMGNALGDQGKFDEAIAAYGEALQRKPDYADAHFNRAMPLLLLGRFEEGWAEYEWRLRARTTHVNSYALLLQSSKVWNGWPLQGRTILVHAEQGLGDKIQFARYAILLKQNGAGRVLLTCPPELLRLMTRCQGVDQVFAEIPREGFDVEVSLLSLPRLLGTTSVEHIPAPLPYLDCDPDLVERWRTRLEVSTGLRVGIAWQGRPTHAGDRWRSAPLEQFAPLALQGGVSLISLQKDVGREQLEKMPGLAVDLGPELTDLADTAAVIRSLDLVITVDTALAHLAGALGKPVWVALPAVPDWRWLLKREDSPWYPSMRLFRQTKLGQWNDVFDRIKSALSVFSPQVGTASHGNRPQPGGH